MNCITLSRRKNPEAQIQRAVVQHLHARGVPGMVWWHTPNGGGRSKIEGAIFKGMGVKAGVADLIFVYQNKIFALELKAEGGRASEAQLAFLSDIDAAGAYTAMPTGLDAALQTLEAWGLIRPSVTMRGIFNNLDHVAGERE